MNVSSVLTSLKYTATLFWVFNALWVCQKIVGVLGFDFGFRASEICLFLCSSLMRFFVVQNFFIFQDSAWLVKKSWCVHCCSIHRFYWLSDRCWSAFALWWFFVRKKLSQIGSFHWLLVLATECFFSFDIFEIHSDAFLGCKCVVGMLTVHGKTKFLILVLCFWNMSFFVFILYAIFCSTIFFIFQGFVWLVKSSWCVHCCSIDQV